MKKVKEYLESTRVQFEAIYWKPDGISHAKRIKDGVHFQKEQELALRKFVVKGISKEMYLSQMITRFEEDFINVIVDMRIVCLYNYEDTADEALYTFMESEGPIPINDIESELSKFLESGIRLLEIEENAMFVNNYKGPQKFNFDA